MPINRDAFWERLNASGIPKVPDEFSVTCVPQTVPRATLAEIERFVRVFDAVTTRPRWQQEVTHARPDTLRTGPQEVCFFSAWDFHLPPGEASQVIEFSLAGR